MTYQNKTIKAFTSVSVAALMALMNINVTHAQSANNSTFSWGFNDAASETDQALRISKLNMMALMRFRN